MPAPQVSQARAEELLGEAKSRFIDAQDQFETRRAILTDNMAFYRGRQWGISTPWGFLGDEWEDDEAREVYNFVRAVVRAAVSDRMKAEVNPEAVATHGDSMSRYRAKASTMLMRSMLHNGIFPAIERMRIALGCEIHGAAWAKVSWDPDVGKFNQVPLTEEDGTPSLDDFGQPRYDVMREGDVRIRYVSAYDALPNPDARTSDEVWYVCHRKMIPVGRLEDMFPEDVFGKPTKGRFGMESRDQSTVDREWVESDNFDTEGAGTRSQANTLAEVVEYWEKPSNRYPAGVMLVWSGDNILAIGPMPHDWPWHLALGQNVIPQSLYADGVVADIKDPQRALNKNASKQWEWVDKILSPPLLDPHGSGIDPSRYSDMAGEIIKYNPGMKPEWMRTPDIPASMSAYGEDTINRIKDVSGYSDLNRGQMPQGMSSGRALAYLSELEQGVRAPDMQVWKEFMVGALMGGLTLIREFYEEGRLVKVLGPAKQWMLVPFQRTRYDLEAEVVVEPDSGRPSSRALRMGETLELAQVGAFSDTPEGQRLRRETEMDSDDREVYAINEIHRDRVRDEHMALLEGRYHEIEWLPEDDHEIHLDEDDRFMISKEFRSLPPQVKEWYRQHKAQHEAFRSQQLEEVAYEQGALNPSGGGGAPPPSNNMASPLDGGHMDNPGPQEMTPTSGETLPQQVA